MLRGSPFFHLCCQNFGFTQKKESIPFLSDHYSVYSPPVSSVYSSFFSVFFFVHRLGYYLFGIKGFGLLCFIGVLNRKHHLNKTRQEKRKEKKKIGEKEKSPILCSFGLSFSRPIFHHLVLLPLLFSSSHSHESGIINLFSILIKKKRKKSHSSIPCKSSIVTNVTIDCHHQQQQGEFVPFFFII